MNDIVTLKLEEDYDILKRTSIIIEILTDLTKISLSVTYLILILALFKETYRPAHLLNASCATFHSVGMARLFSYIWPFTTRNTVNSGSELGPLQI